MAKEYKAFEKQPSDEYDFTMDFAPAMKSGGTIASIVTTKATRMSDNADTTVIVLGTTTFSGTRITQRIKAGADGERHKIQWLITDSNGEKHEWGVIMEIVEL